MKKESKSRPNRFGEEYIFWKQTEEILFFLFGYRLGYNWNWILGDVELILEIHLNSTSQGESSKIISPVWKTQYDYLEVIIIHIPSSTLCSLGTMKWSLNRLQEWFRISENPVSVVFRRLVCVSKKNYKVFYFCDFE